MYFVSFRSFFIIKITLTEMHVVFRKTTTEQLIQLIQSKSVCTQFCPYNIEMLSGIPTIMCNVVARNLFSY